MVRGLFLAKSVEDQLVKRVGQLCEHDKTILASVFALPPTARTVTVALCTDGQSIVTHEKRNTNDHDEGLVRAHCHTQG